MLKEQEHFTYIFKHTNMSKFGLKKERMAASAGLSHVGFAGEWGDFNTKAGDEVFTPLTPPCLEESSGPVQHFYWNRHFLTAFLAGGHNQTWKGAFEEEGVNLGQYELWSYFWYIFLN